MIENLPNHLGLGDERKDLKSPTTLTEEGVGFEDPLYQICPSPSESGALFGGRAGLVGCGRLIVAGGGGIEFQAMFFPPSSCS